MSVFSGLNTLELGDVFSYTSDNIELASQEFGNPSNTCIILLHGFPGGPASCRDLARHLEQLDYYVVVPALRGYWPSASPKSVRSYRMAQMAKDVVDLAKRLSIDSFHIVGHDLGGTIAWYLACNNIDGLLSCSILSTPHIRALVGSLRHSNQILRSWYAGLFLLPLIPESLLKLKGGWIANRYLQNTGLDESQSTKYIQELIDHGRVRSAMNWYRAFTLDLGELTRLTRLVVPSFYIWGGKDSIISRYAATSTPAVISGSLGSIEIRSGTHWLMEQDAQRVAELVSGHISASSTRS